MLEQEFINHIIHQQELGTTEVRATLHSMYRGVKHILIQIDGHANGNRNDLWILSASRLQTKGRAYIGSQKIARNLEGWPDRIAHFS